MSRFTLDIPIGDPAPQPGDLIASARRLYRIDHVEPVETRVRCDRWRCTVQVVAKRTHPDQPFPDSPEGRLGDGARLWPTGRYPQGQPPSVYWGIDR